MTWSESRNLPYHPARYTLAVKEQDKVIQAEGYESGKYRPGAAVGVTEPHPEDDSDENNRR